MTLEFLCMTDGSNASEVKSRTDCVLRKARAVSKCLSFSSIEPVLKESLQTCRKLSVWCPISEYVFFMQYLGFVGILAGRDYLRFVF